MNRLNPLSDSSFFRHWREKHERYIKQFLCGLCAVRCKRKSDLIRHIRHRHDTDCNAESQGPIEYLPNRQFIDPQPHTLESVMAGKFDP